jgi:poly(hydroxyalkanoate) depolymerase family esterase
MQDAASYDHGSGWSRLADEQGFALLYPEQQRGNNANLCFNWFNPADTRRGAGETLSIRQMVAAMIAAHAIDPARVYVTGLSAGGAMTSAMLAAYPDVFAGGAIIAGLPYGTAATVPEAFDRMRAHGGPPAEALGALVTAASPHPGPWPTISVWHGDADATVSHANSALIVEQWRAVHGVEREPTVVETVNGHRRKVWRDVHGREVIEEYRIAGLAHGTPLSTAGPDACGSAAPYMLEAGISSTRRIADFWDLAGKADGLPRGEPVGTAEPASTLSHSAIIDLPHEDAGRNPHAKPMAGSVGRVIEDALRAAGLMR